MACQTDADITISYACMEANGTPEICSLRYDPPCDPWPPFVGGCLPSDDYEGVQVCLAEGMMGDDSNFNADCYLLAMHPDRAAIEVAPECGAEKSGARTVNIVLAGAIGLLAAYVVLVRRP